jgi:PAP2 superfamily C-terminal
MNADPQDKAALVAEFDRRGRLIRPASSPPEGNTSAAGLSAANRPALRLRVAFVVLALSAWFATQALIGRRQFDDAGIGDLVHQWTAVPHDYLLTHPRAANALLIASSGVIDALGIFLLASAIFGPSLRPFLALLMLFALRQSCQLLCSLPAPEAMIWRSPGVPSLLVTYGVSTDLFFSGHTGLAVLGALELSQFGKRWLSALGVLIALFEAGTVLILRAHYTMDVFTGAVTALVAYAAARQLAPHCDRWLARRGRRVHSIREK